MEIIEMLDLLVIGGGLAGAYWMIKIKLDKTLEATDKNREVAKAAVESFIDEVKELKSATIHNMDARLDRIERVLEKLVENNAQHREDHIKITQILEHITGKGR